ncbi:Histidine kinase [Paenibacillus lupini]|nr:O-antigen/teichoic acid export membrane protein [Paenibacillus lupini]
MKKPAITYLVSILPTIVTIMLLIRFFPYTGLGRIISVPLTILLNLVFLLVSLIVVQRIRSKVFQTLCWCASILITIVNAIVMHPQESSPSVFNQLIEKFNNITS